MFTAFPTMKKANLKSTVKQESVLSQAMRALDFALESEERDLEFISLVHQFIWNVVLIRNLYECFQNSQRRSIAGDDGVASQQKISRTAVIKRIRSLGLKPNDFRHPDLTTDRLIAKSSIAGQSKAIDRYLKNRLFEPTRVRRSKAVRK